MISFARTLPRPSRSLTRSVPRIGARARNLFAGFLKTDHIAPPLEGLRSWYPPVSASIATDANNRPLRWIRRGRLPVRERQPLLAGCELVIFLRVVLDDKDHPNIVGIERRSLGKGFLQLFDPFLGLSRILSLSPKIMVPVGQDFTQAGIRLLVILSKHIVHLKSSLDLGSCRGDVVRASLQSRLEVKVLGLWGEEHRAGLLILDNFVIFRCGHASGGQAVPALIREKVPVHFAVPVHSVRESHQFPGVSGQILRVFVAAPVFRLQWPGTDSIACRLSDNLGMQCTWRCQLVLNILQTFLHLLILS